MNSDFVWKQATALAERLQAEAPSEPERISRAYKLLFGRSATQRETRLAQDFLARNKGEWRLLAHALLASTEFIFVN
jgi:hypothetical protein